MMLKKFLRVLSYVFFALLFTNVALLAWLRSTDATASDVKSFKRGDVIFQTSKSGQSLAILMASKSPFSHMGIIDFDETGSPVVLEATATTRATALQSWVNKGLGQRIAVYRLASLSDADAAAVSTAARTHFGKKYDQFFYASDDELYCSELVFLAFKAGAHISLGKYQKANTLDLANFAARKVIESRWKMYPLCANGQATDFESCFAIIQEQELITPQSIADDRQLLQIYSNYGG